ncbi:WXG100-like domain-containing protein [Nocardia amamiensis]|uniref:WXG100-like domain-containing protein n=1 Tax=Nocardia amamiensis TaxID=404578 RepID=UPI004039675C
MEQRLRPRRVEHRRRTRGPGACGGADARLAAVHRRQPRQREFTVRPAAEPERPGLSAGHVDGLSAYRTPAAYGGHDPEPTGWDWVKGAVQGELWPNGHPDVLRKAAAAWRTMANSLRIAAARCDCSRADRGAAKSRDTPSTRARRHLSMSSKASSTTSRACVKNSRNPTTRTRILSNRPRQRSSMR